MKKFLEELGKTSKYMYNAVPVNTEAQQKFNQLRNKYRDLIGKRALLVDKVNKESRVVVIEGVYRRYVLVSFKYFGMDYKGKMHTSICFGSLICGDVRLDVE